MHLVGGRRVVVPAGAEPDLAAYPFAFSARERAMGLGAIWEAVFGPLLAAADDVRAPDWPPPPLRPLDALTPTAYLRREGWSPGVDALLGLGWNDPGGATLSLLEELRIAALDPGAARLKVVGGTDLLPRAMAARLGGRIRYGRPVVRVEQDAGGVRVHALGAGGPEVFAAERAVIAAPFPPLRRVGFYPPLSAGKRRAIAEMTYAALTRVPLQVRSRPFEAHGLSGFALTDLPSEVWHTTWDRPGERGVVTVYAKEQAARRLAALGPDERVASAAAHAEAVLPGLSPEVEGGVAKCWDEDPWASGAHALLSPGQVTALMPHVATPEGRLHFAGEHTSPWHGWMQGALGSGERAAAEVEAAA